MSLRRFSASCTRSIQHIRLRGRSMSSFKLPAPNAEVSVSLPDGLSPDQLQSFRPFNTWISTLTRSLGLQSHPRHPFHADPYALRSVTVQSFDRFGGGRLGFVKMAAAVSNTAGESLPAAALLRGPSVAMLVMLVPEDAAPAESGSADRRGQEGEKQQGGEREQEGDREERYVVLTVQPRVPAGSLSFVELPAGMVDDVGTFRGAAAKEIEEELGITISEDELVCLSELAAEAAAEGDAEGGAEGTAKAEPSGEELAAAVFPSAGGCDEHVTIYSYERRIPRTQLSEWEGRLTGLRAHGEKITLKLVAMRDAWKEGARDAKCLSALALWQGLRRERRI